MVLHPTEVIVGVSDLQAMATFFAALGFEAGARRVVPPETARALYGLDEGTEEVALRAGTRDAGGIRLVATPHVGEPSGPYDCGGYDISLYCSDIDGAAEIAREAGARVGPVGVLELGPLVLHQRQAIGPDDVRIVLIQSATRRASLLDDEPDRVFSEVHSLVWCVDDVEAAARFWREAGLVQAFDMPIAHPAVSHMLELPRADVPIRMALLSNESVSPIRFELLQFPDDAGAQRGTDPLRPGIAVLAFHAEDLDATMERMKDATVHDRIAVDGSTRVRGVAPGGVSFELRGP